MAATLAQKNPMLREESKIAVIIVKTYNIIRIMTKVMASIRFIKVSVALRYRTMLTRFLRYLQDNREFLQGNRGI